MAEKTNVGVAFFVADNTCVGSGRMELLCSYLRARLSAAAVISLSTPDLRPSQDIVSMSTAFISLTQTSLYRR